MIYYKHTQPGYAMAAFLGACIILTLALALISYNAALIWTAIIVQIIILALFSTLTVAIDDKYMAIKFGPGLVGKRFELKGIAAASEVKNRWWFGIGINYIAQRWLFNVSGLDAVEIRMRNGKHYRIGTDRPHELKRAVDQAIYEHDPKFYGQSK